MQSFPPEILALIIVEMWREGISLSSVSLVSPDIVPVVREQRFQHLQVSGLRRTAGLVAIIDSTPEISTVIRTIHANSTSEENMASKLGELIHLLSKIGNLERLSLHCDMTSRIPSPRTQTSRHYLYPTFVCPIYPTCSTPCIPCPTCPISPPAV